ncbi:MAG TPA: hypothetical protein VHT96_12465 [Clostridia bacterium]|nr:hypothetical protein [Clostridia bacterium]
MNRIMARLKDILLYPAKFFESLTDRKATLIAGAVMVGAIDFLLPDINNNLKLLFYGKPTDDIIFNAFMAVFAILLLGLVDVIFMGAPLYDIFAYLKKKEAIMSEEDVGEDYTTFSPHPESKAPIEHNASLTKVIKGYVISHFIIVPVETAIYYLLLRNITDNSPTWMQNLSLIFMMVIFVWSAAILTRGINVLFRFNPVFRRLTFIIVFTWNFILSMVFATQILNWVLKLFR